jgi:hypothetical protein
MRFGNLRGGANNLVNAINAGIAWVTQSRGMTDPITAIAYATGNSYEYWVIMQALYNQGLSASVDDVWGQDILSSPAPTSQPQSTAADNMAACTNLSANIGNLTSAASVLQAAYGYGAKYFQNTSTVAVSGGSATSGPAAVSTLPTTANTGTVTTSAGAATVSSAAALPATSSVIATAPITVIPVAAPASAATTAVSDTTSTSSGGISWLTVGVAAAALYFISKRG